MSDLAETVKGIVIETLNGATTQSVEAGIDPGIVLGSIAATALATLRSFGVPKENIDALVAMSENSAAKIDLVNAIPAGNA